MSPAAFQFTEVLTGDSAFFHDLNKDSTKLQHFVKTREPQFAVPAQAHVLAGFAQFSS